MKGSHRSANMPTASKPTFLVVGAGEPETVRIGRVFEQYGHVHRAIGPDDARIRPFIHADLTAAYVAWSGQRGRYIFDLAFSATRPSSFSLLLVASVPTPELLKLVFHAQEVGHHNVRLVPAPVAEGDVRPFIEASIKRNQASQDASQADVDLVEHVRSQGVEVGLTARELQVLQLAMAGVERSSLAGRLRIAPSTLRSHVRAILGKFAIHTPARSMAELVNVLLRGEGSSR